MSQTRTSPPAASQEAAAQPHAGTTTRAALFATTAATLVAGVRRVSGALHWVSRAAWVTLGVVVAAAIAGSVLGWVELVAIAAGLGAVLVAAIAFTIGRHPYAVSLRLRDHRVVVGERAMGGIHVVNVGEHRVLPARIELPVGAGRAGFALPALPAGGEHEELFAIPTQRRSVIQVGPVRSVRGDPLGLLRRTVTWTEPQELYVHPRTIRLSSSSAGYVHDLEGRESRDLTSADLSFHALREYTPGDDRRTVHWRSSARTGTLMVRQFVETRRSHLVLLLSRNRRDYASDAAEAEFELAISSVGSFGLQAVRDERDLSALTTHEALRAGTADQLLDELTRLELGSGTASLVDGAREVSRDFPRASIVVMACGSGVTPHQLRAAASVLPSGAQVLAIRAHSGGETLVRRVSGLAVLEIGSLTELPRAHRKAER
ncbi:protein of unknown function DUF58 [Beutenbergia cavernae DSM 12333]|uniref:DUF58 domain-containing protein n=1 Tax=Beutenbergia cavernae (strain ATCC BAA-8 / DSM 12333 / CCUG 43141 / JCM 11478 / NBRC 16432 / NCIMB 13614 / HKI 0122) TaxID=471853 RepID=C5C4N9_BEUC1|nr:DUF58 domain-containing protein [Beutenbergia cavernae]ACQ80017.1 protein of unknown function DUF58 [Beutenbergia cavernae DSM 12333]